MKRVLVVLAAIPLLLVAVLAVFRLAAYLGETETAEALAPGNGQFVGTSLGRVHVSRWGDPARPTVVLTHGMAAWGGLWTETAEMLAANGYAVIAIDQAPFGFSDADVEDFSTEAGARRIGEALTALGITTATLAGHSYGGGIAIEAALQYPHLFDSVILACPVTVFGSADAGTVRDVPLPLRNTVVAEVLVAATVTNPLMTRTLLRQFMTRDDRLTDAHVEILQRPMNRRGNTRAMAVWLQQFLAGSPHAKSANPRMLKRLTMPVALIWGEQDTVVTLAEAERLTAFLKARSLRVIPGVGHMPQLEAPAEFNAHLLAALRAQR